MKSKLKAGGYQCG